jgi:hypothetical protein
VHSLHKLCKYARLGVSVSPRLSVERLEARDLPSFRSLPVFPFQDLAVLDHMRAIAALGRQIGRRADVVLKIGDSNSSPFPTADYLAPLGKAGYDPTTSGLAATHPELLDTWWEYRTAPNSLAREGPSARPGRRTPQVLAALPGEIGALNPGIALVMIGTNDAMVTKDQALFRTNLGQMVETLLAARVVPVLSTIPDSHFRGGAYQPVLMAFNQVVAEVAARYVVPLWNAWAGLHRLPNHGLRPDGVHLNASPNGAARFWPVDLLFAQNVRNLGALRILDWFRERVSASAHHSAPVREWLPMDSGRDLYAVGRDVGTSSRVDVYDAETNELVNRFAPFRAGYSQGVHVATGDTDGDGFTDVVCWSTNAGVVRVVSGADGSTLARFRPFDGGTSRHFSIAVGDLDGDLDREIVASRGGREPEVRVFSGESFALQTSFRPYAGRMRGVSVAIAAIEGIGPVIALVGGKAHPNVSYVSPAGQLAGAFAVEAGSGRGLTIAAADLDDDGFDEIVLGRTAAISELLIFDGPSHLLFDRRPLGPVADSTFGARLGVLRSRAGEDLLLVGNAPGSEVSVRAYDDISGDPVSLPLGRANRAFGIFVG